VRLCRYGKVGASELVCQCTGVERRLQAEKDAKSAAAAASAPAAAAAPMEEEDGDGDDQTGTAASGPVLSRRCCIRFFAQNVVCLTGCIQGET
jgi:hypothetical protein